MQDSCSCLFIFIITMGNSLQEVYSDGKIYTKLSFVGSLSLFCFALNWRVALEAFLRGDTWRFFQIGSCYCRVRLAVLGSNNCADSEWAIGFFHSGYAPRGVNFERTFWQFANKTSLVSWCSIKVAVGLDYASEVFFLEMRANYLFSFLCFQRLIVVKLITWWKWVWLETDRVICQVKYEKMVEESKMLVRLKCLLRIYTSVLVWVWPYKQFRKDFILVAGDSSKLLGDLKCRFEILIYILACVYSCEVFKDVTFLFSTFIKVKSFPVKPLSKVY